MEKLGNKKLRFIPFRKQDVVEMCVQSIPDKTADKFRKFSKMLESIYHFEFHKVSENLKDEYAKYDPDSDTRTIDSFNKTSPPGDNRFVESLEALLEKANYERITEADLNLALCESSVFKIRLEVDFEDFDEVLLFCRGEHQREETFFRLWRWLPKTIKFTNYERVVVYLKFKQQLSKEAESLGTCVPGASLLKLFQNVPQADLEMLFPNTQVKMRLLDKLLIGIPALISGAVVLTTKMTASLILLGTLIGFWFGFHQKPVVLDKTALLILLAGVGAFGGYLWKQFNNFKNRKLTFMQSLTQNLYFKNLDNNAGVIFRLVNEAEEEECKEALLAYYFLLIEEKPLSIKQLDQKIENWFLLSWHCELDFEIDDAIDKLVKLELVEKISEQYQAIKLEQALSKMDSKWDNYFNYS